LEFRRRIPFTLKAHRWFDCRAGASPASCRQHSRTSSARNLHLAGCRMNRRSVSELCGTHERRYSFTMKVEVEKQPGFISKLQIELPPEEVTKEWDAIAISFARFAKIPGYRPGKAPRAVIDKRFRKEIQEELTKKLVSKGYHEAIEQQQLRVASLTNIEDVQFGEDKSMRFRATVVTAPEFELPDYKNIPVHAPDKEFLPPKSTRRWSVCVINQLILSMCRAADCKWAISRCLILKVRWIASRSVKSRRRPARICKAVKNSGCSSRLTIFCRNFASS
jgi:hypothetical protein